MTKEITINDLAELIKQNSEDIKGVSQRVDNVSQKLDKVSGDLEDLIVTTKKGFDDTGKSLKEARIDVGVEIKMSEQVTRDYIDKRTGEAEGRIIPKINTLTNVLREKGAISAREMASVQSAGAEI